MNFYSTLIMVDGASLYSWSSIIMIVCNQNIMFNGNFEYDDIQVQSYAIVYSSEMTFAF